MPPDPPPQPHPSQLAALILNYTTGPTTPSPSFTPSCARSLAVALLSHTPPIPLPLPPGLTNSVLKHLWHHGPAALLFFRSLLHFPSPTLCLSSSSTLDLALDLSARLRHRSLTLSVLRLYRRLNLPYTSHTFPILFERYAASGRPDIAVRLFLSLHRSPHHHPQSLPLFNSLLDALAKSRHVSKASSLVRALRQRFPPDAVTFNTLADGWCRVKKTSEALDVLKDMVESGVPPTVNTYNILLKGFFRAGQIRHACKFFLEMKRRGKKDESCRPDVVTYTTVVHGLGVSGQVERARKVFAEMRQEGCEPSVATYNALIQVVCKKGNVEDAVVVFDDMVKKGCVRNVVTYTVLIHGLCHAGKMGQAMELLEMMKSEGCEPNVQIYNVLIRYWCEEGEIDKGLELFDRMGKGGECLPNLDTYNVVISAMFVRKRAEDMLVAGKMVVEMVERGYLPRKFMFNRILNGLLLTGNQKFARELLRMQERYRRLQREIRL